MRLGQRTALRLAQQLEWSSCLNVTSGCNYRYEPRGGPIGRFTGPLIDKMLTAAFTDMLAATEKGALANG